MSRNVANDDGLDPETRAWWNGLMRRLKLDVVRTLLSGNDTGCFTSEQYLKLWKERRRVEELLLHDYIPPDLAEAHLRSLADVVEEVSPGVWRMKEGRTDA